MASPADTEAAGDAKRRRVGAQEMDPAEVRKKCWEAGSLMKTSFCATIRCGDGTPKFRLQYFPIRGLVDLAQLVLEESGTPYDLEVVGMDDFRAGKTSLPFGRLPVLLDYDGNGNDLAQSDAILRFLASQVGLAGATGSEQAKSDMVYSQYQDTLGSPDNFAPSALQEAATEKIVRYRETSRRNQDSLCAKSLASLQCFEDILESSATGFLVGQSVTYADLAVFLRLFELDEEDYVPSSGWKWAEAFPCLAKFFTTMLERPRIKAYLQSARRMPRIEAGVYTYKPGKFSPKP